MITGGLIIWSAERAADVLPAYATSPNRRRGS